MIWKMKPLVRGIIGNKKASLKEYEDSNSMENGDNPKNLKTFRSRRKITKGRNPNCIKYFVSTCRDRV